MCIDANSYEDFSVGLVGSIVREGVDSDCRFGERNSELEKQSGRERERGF